MAIATSVDLLDPTDTAPRPVLSPDSWPGHAIGLDRNELGALFVASRPTSSPQDHALRSLLALNGLRISEVLRRRHHQLGL